MSDKRGKSGGKARAQILTTERKREIASAASQARWNKTKETVSVVSVELDSIKMSVTKLSEKDRQSLLDYLLLLRQDEKPTSDQERKLAMWTDSLNLALSKMLGQTHRIFPHVLLPQARKILKDVTAFMKENDLGNLKTGETKAMYNLLAKILVNYASIVSAKARIPLSMKLVVQTTTPVVSLFDNHFPGYVKSKLIMQVLIASTSGITGHNDDEDD